MNHLLTNKKKTRTKEKGAKQVFKKRKRESGSIRKGKRKIKRNIGDT
jgi:hypothetical protein